MSNDYEGDDRREKKYNNIQHPFFLKPEFVVSSFFASIIVVITGTLWITSYVGAVEDKVTVVDNKVIINSAEISYVRRTAEKSNAGLQNQMQEIKSQQMEIKRDLNKRFDRLQDGVDALIQQELHKE